MTSCDQFAIRAARDFIPPDIAIEFAVPLPAAIAAAHLRERITVTGQRERTAEIQLSLNANPIFHSVPSAKTIPPDCAASAKSSGGGHAIGCCIRERAFCRYVDGRDLQRPIEFRFAQPRLQRMNQFARQTVFVVLVAFDQAASGAPATMP